jgi:hypothetical protein
MNHFLKNAVFPFIISLIILIISCDKEKEMLPVVNTTGLWYIFQRSARAGGEVTGTGGVPILARGVCWNKSGSPTLADSHTTESGDMETFVSTLNGQELATKAVSQPSLAVI